MAFGKKKGDSTGGGHDDRCPECGGVAGRHNQVRMSRPIPGKTPLRYKIVHESCPRSRR